MRVLLRYSVYLVLLRTIACDGHFNKSHERKLRQTPGASNGCDATIDEEEGWFFSSNYPSDYDHDRTCRYEIRKYRDDVCRVELTFMDFDVDESPGCYADYLELQEGLPGGQRICGTLAAGTKKTLTFPPGRNSMTSVFRSDSSKARKGFMVKVNQLRNSCHRRVEPDDNVYPENCDQRVDGEFGTLTSPGYPGGYPNNVRCRYTIRRAHSSICQVNLIFRRFDVEESRGCEGDFLELEGRRRLCGRYQSPISLTFPPGGYELTMTFQSNDHGTGGGFEIDVRQVETCDYDDYRPPTPVPPYPPPPPPPPPPSRCDQIVSRLRGHFTSPNFPRPYGPNEVCRYTVQRAEPTVCRVIIYFHIFSLRADGYGCNRDYLELSDGTRLCGTIRGRKTLAFPRTENELRLTFYSQGYGYDGGFDIYVHQIPCGRTVFPDPSPWDDMLYDFWDGVVNLGQQIWQNVNRNKRDAHSCDKEIMGLEGRITSPGFPADYPDENKCRYLIRKAQPDVCIVEIDFLTFELSNGVCTGDFFQLPDGKRLCGLFRGSKLYKFLPGAVNMHMAFVSDSYGTGKGFEILVRQRPESCVNNRPSRESCDRTLIGETEVIQSPGYPGDYLSGSHCIYTIRRADLRVCRLQLDFLTFDVVESPDCLTDFLQIESTGERICGRNIPSGKVLDFPAGTDSIRLTFQSRYSRLTRRGFEIRVRQLRDSCYGPLETTTRVCASVTEYASVIQSDRHPIAYDPDTECVYRIVRASSAVCRVELAFTRFDVGTGRDRVCIGDYLDIPGQGRFCGRRDGETVTVEFPDNQQELLLRFKTDGYDQHTGFRIEVRQLISGCRNQPPVNQECGELFGQESFDVMSPGFQNGSYRPNEDCRYQVRKYSFDVCALEVRYNVFDIEESDDCAKDYLEIRDLKICGKLPLDSTRTYEFPEDTLSIRFRSDAFNQRAGFFFSARQKKC